MSTITTFGKIVSQLTEAYTEDKELHGALVVFWDADNSVSAAYAGSPLDALQAVDLALNGARAMLSQSMADRTPTLPKEGAKDAIRLVDSED
jgi:hypothetical protein